MNPIQRPTATHPDPLAGAEIHFYTGQSRSLQLGARGVGKEGEGDEKEEEEEGEEEGNEMSGGEMEVSERHQNLSRLCISTDRSGHG